MPTWSARLCCRAQLECDAQALLRRRSDTMRQDIDGVGIFGAGAMGRGSAQVCAAAGCDVHLFDVAAEAVSRARDPIRDAGAHPAGHRSGAATRLRSRGRGDRGAARPQAAAIPQPRGACFAGLHPGNQHLITQRHCDRRRLRASPASAGWHFFNPAPRRRLVEVVRRLSTSTTRPMAAMRYARCAPA
jgi:3-hydroxybutyryl-CoA dehydrogenase